VTIRLSTSTASAREPRAIIGELTTAARRAIWEMQSFRALARAGAFGVEPLRRLRTILAARRDFGTAGSATLIAALRRPTGAAIADERGELTYAQLDEQVNRLANALRAHGLGAGSSVGILCRNHRSPLIVGSAAARVGMNAIWLNTAFSARQAGEVAAREGVELLVHDAEFSELVSGISVARGRLAVAGRGGDARHGAVRRGDLQPLRLHGGLAGNARHTRGRARRASLGRQAAAGRARADSRHGRLRRRARLHRPHLRRFHPPFEGYTGGGGKEVVHGLLSSGDVGHFDANGRLYIDGRDDEMIISGGENVFPREIEELLATHPAIADAAVIGVEDSEFGQRLRAFVVLRDGREVSVEEARAFARENLARYKVPRDVVFLDELPRNPTGKILKRELVARAD
jgi:acyl-CoA synthetase (AMP-forming)/AMP-acid ligase II